jgi:hypothetical protein
MLEPDAASSSTPRADDIQRGLTRITYCNKWRNAIGRFAPAGTAARVFDSGTASFVRGLSSGIDH